MSPIVQVVGLNGERYPEEDIEEINRGVVFEREHGEHIVFVQHINRGLFRFRVDDSVWMTCLGHPITHAQGTKIPSAVDIFLKKGNRPHNFKFTWARHWRRQGPVMGLYGWV